MLLHKIIGSYLTREGKAMPNFNSKGTLLRTMEVGAFDEKKRTVELAFSSEIEVERWFGIEILDHSAGSVRLDRLKDGGAVLVNHDWNDQVGVVESVEIGADRRGRAVVRFGRSERADEIFQDIADGIRKHVSVGYSIFGAKLTEEREGDVDVYTITDWEPFEISIVSVPADTTVGVGRSLETPQEEEPAGSPQTEAEIITAAKTTKLSEEVRIMKIKNIRDASGNLVRAEVDENDNIIKVLEVLEEATAAVRSAQTNAAEGERRRAASILEMGDKYNCAELARKYVADGKSADEFARAALDKINTSGGARQASPIADMKSPDIGLTDKEARSFSLMRAVRAMMPNASNAEREAAKFEFECSAAAARALGKEAKGIIIPEDVLSRAFNTGGAANTPAGSQSGAYAVDTTFMGGSFIEMLRNKTSIMRLGTSMGGLVGNVDIPRQTGGSTAYWVGEGDDANEGAPTLGQIELSPKTVAAYSDITRRLMMQSSLDAEGILRRDLINAVAQAIDLAGFYGSGTDKQPRGLKNYTGINGVDFAVASSPTFAELVQMESEVAADNADVNQMAYIMNARMRGYLKTKTKFGSSTELTCWEPGNTVNGYRTEITNQLGNDDVFFGNFADLLIGMWGGVDLTVDPYALSKSGGTRLVIFQDVDFALRRVESVCWGSSTVA